MSAFSDQLKGKWNQIKGQVKQEYGEAAGDRLSYNEGKEDEALGQLQEAMGKTKEEVKSWIDSL